MKTEKKPRSLNITIISFLIFCWVIPLIVLLGFTTLSYRQGIITKADGLMRDQLSNIASFASIRIEDAINVCQRPSYDKTWENSYEKYKANEVTKTEYLQEINNSLKSKFYLDERFHMYAFYRFGSEHTSCYSASNDLGYREYVEKIEPAIWDIIESDSSYTYLRVINGELYVIRNLYTTKKYERFGTLVVGLNKDKMFQDVSPIFLENMSVCVGDSGEVLSFLEPKEVEETKKLRTEALKLYDTKKNQQTESVRGKSYNCYLYQESQEDYHIGIMLMAKKRDIYSSLYEFYTIVIAMLALFIPLLCYGVYFLRRNIQVPVEKMMQAYKKMEAGEIGITIEEDDMPNLEFQYMKESFNSMSAQVKYLFDYIYDEKLARKDAQIQALQAQINPHFLNNTLEMMNWQARMSGDVVVSKMIESLGLVLDYRMNRANVKEIYLMEELQCIDAYFYIMSMRFGQRLSIEKEIDDKLLDIMVPPLILQPLIENAIIHGVETVKNGAIRLKVYHDAKNVYLEVWNTGKELTEEDKKRIQAMLSGDSSQIPKTPGRHTSIGIQNVNTRIHLMYGEEYGLDITQEENFETRSRITLPYQLKEKVEYQSRDEVKKEIKDLINNNTSGS